MKKNKYLKINYYSLKTVLPQYIFGIVAIGLLLNGTNPLYLVASWLSWFLFYVVGEGMFLHKYYTHNAFKCKTWLARSGGVLGVLGAYGSPILFKITHTVHHAYSDTDRDPHTPKDSIWRAVFGWSLDSRLEDRHLMIAKQLLVDKFQFNLEKYAIHIWWAFFTLMAIIDWKLAFFVCLGSSIGMIFTCLTNSLAHMYGSRRFDTSDNSRNIWWLSWLCWQGSGALQNNHHAHPTRQSDSFDWYEFDIGKYLIPIFEKI